MAVWAFFPLVVASRGHPVTVVPGSALLSAGRSSRSLQAQKLQLPGSRAQDQ